MIHRVAEQERQFVQHLLGRLSEAEAERLEERLFVDDELRAELLATADDLIYAYLSGSLVGEDRARFEAHFLASPRHQERLAYIRDLLAAIERLPAASVAGWPRTAGPRVFGLAPAWVLAAGLALVVTGGLLWFMFRPTGREVRQADASPLPASPRPSAVASALTPVPSPLVQPSPGIERTAPSTRGRSQGDVRLVQLPRQPDGTQSVALGTQTRVVRVEVAVDPGPPSFDAILRRSDGTEVWRMEGLVPASLGKPLVLDVPARLLAAAEYALRIEGENVRGTAAPPVVLEYSLRVSRER